MTDIESTSRTVQRIVLVTQRIDYIESYDETRDALDQRLVDWVNRAGYSPVPVPNTLISGDFEKNNSDPLRLKEWIEQLDPSALILSGGNDIGQYAQRDLTEGHLLNWAQEVCAPVLGICRGMQFMAIWAGGNLTPVEGHVNVRHQLTLIDDEKWPAEVNSYHNWGLEDTPEGFQALAWTEDGVVEAMCHNSLPWEAWMWHPERENEMNKIDQTRLINLIDRGMNE